MNAKSFQILENIYLSPESRKNFRNVGKSKQKILNNGNNKELNKTHINVKCPYTHTAFLL